jgi:hypothetical protein
MLIDGVQNQAAELVLLKKMTEVEYGAFIWQRIGQRQPGKSAHGLNLIERIFHCRIAEVVEKLHTMNAEHDQQRVSWTASRFDGAVFGELLVELVPGNQLIHFRQKDFAAGLALLILVFEFGEGHLGHGWSSC